MFNQFTGIGNLSADPEIRYSAAGNAVAKYTVCVDVGFGDNKGTEFVRCVSFGKLAEVIGEYLSKGKKVFVQGEMKTNQWEDKDGNKRYTTEIIVNTMKILSPKESTGERQGGHQASDSMGEDIPFSASKV